MGAMQSLSGWGSHGNALVREFSFESFVKAMEFLNQVAGQAEAAGHHPDMHVFYNRVRLELSTHDEGGVTEKDVELARVISGLY